MTLRFRARILLILMFSLIVVFSPHFCLISSADEPTIDQLKTDLRSSDVKVRRKAAVELGKTKNRRAVQPLLEAATDRDIGVREEVVKSLGLLRDETAITMLLTTIKDPAESVREESIISLVNLYADQDKEFVMTRISKKVYKKINPFSDQVGNDPTVIESYVRVGPTVIESISDRLIDSNPAIRIDAAKALGILRGKEAIPKMVEAMKTGDGNLRIAVLRSLYKIKETRVDEQILPYLHDSNKSVRDETILTLGLFRSQKALPELQRIYDQNPDTKLRLKAFQAISLIGDPSSLELFRRNLRDPDKEYRQAAAEGIARAGEPSLAEEVSRTFLNEKSTGAQFAMSFALYRLGRKEYMDKLISGVNERMYNEQVTSYFIEMSSLVVPDLIKNLNHESPTVRVKLCYVLGMIGDKSALESLKERLKDTNNDVVSEAALAIRRLGASS